MKQKIFKKGIERRLFSVVLALAMIMSLMPMNSMTVKAGDCDRLYCSASESWWDKIEEHIANCICEGRDSVTVCGDDSVFCSLHTTLEDVLNSII